uniref:Uncharacterized protein n=1 Tax=Myoviridae sp. ctv204 TaxID=2825202 RepID=A0A8S5UKD4_9CAUD|nr:MAG TPA: hypothetical protein [Myoviridae sp. ctv204]
MADGGLSASSIPSSLRRRPCHTPNKKGRLK